MNRLRIKPVSLAAFAAGLALLAAPYAADAKAIVVNDGDSIQAAVDAAPAGGTVLVTAGTYVETHGNQAAVTITKPLKLIAKLKRGEKAVITPGPGNTEGIWIKGAAGARVKNVLIKGFTIEGFSENGIWPYYAEKFKIFENTVGDSEHVGIYPYLSYNGLVKENVSYGGLDSALWVAGSERIRVVKNVVYEAPTGLQVSVSRNLKFSRNQAYNNVVGLGIYHSNATAADDEPGIHPERDKTGLFVKNNLRNNNLPNPVSTGLVGNLPSGIGAAIVGADGAHLKKNIIVDNNYVGIAVVEWCLVNQDYNVPPDANCYPDDTVISDNIILDNGTDPPDHLFSALASDVIVLGVGTDFCPKNNVYGNAPTLDAWKSLNPDAC